MEIQENGNRLIEANSGIQVDSSIRITGGIKGYFLYFRHSKKGLTAKSTTKIKFEILATTRGVCSMGILAEMKILSLA